MGRSLFSVCHRTAAAILSTVALACGAPLLAQGADDGQPIELASLDIPGGFALPPREVEAANDTGLIPAPGADATGPGQARMSAELDRQLRWKKARSLEIVFQALNLVDGVQTISCLRSGMCSESNPLFGRNPSTAKIVGVKAAGGLVHLLGTRYLFKRNSRYLKTFQIGSIAIQGGVVAWNTQFMF